MGFSLLQIGSLDQLDHSGQRRAKSRLTAVARTAHPPAGGRQLRFDRFDGFFA